MSYQVIARKWRPQTFEEVTGQEAITRTLRNAIEHERLHHAYLFSGARGVGKTTTARLLAKAVNCHRSERPTPTPCRTDDPLQCDSCREITEGRSIDVLEIDAASNRGIDSVRDTIISGININPARDRHKVFIIDEVHMLTTESFNALLKTLEEPPPRVLFVMATTHSHKVPVTILSRSQLFEFRTIAASKIASRLRHIADEERIEVTDDALREIARAGEGSMRDAQSAFDQVISFSEGKIGTADVEAALGLAGVELRARVMRAVAETRPAEALAVVEDLAARGHDLRNFCRDLLAHVRDLLVFKVAGDGAASAEMTEAERTELADEAREFSESDLVRFFHSLTETEGRVRESAHPRYQLEIGLVKLIEMRRLVPLGQLLERIGALEEALRTGKPLAATPGAQSPPSSAPAGGTSRRGGAAGGGGASSFSPSSNDEAPSPGPAASGASSTSTSPAEPAPPVETPLDATPSGITPPVADSADDAQAEATTDADTPAKKSQGGTTRTPLPPTPVFRSPAASGITPPPPSTTTANRPATTPTLKLVPTPPVGLSEAGDARPPEKIYTTRAGATPVGEVPFPVSNGAPVSKNGPASNGGAPRSFFDAPTPPPSSFFEEVRAGEERAGERAPSSAPSQAGAASATAHDAPQVARAVEPGDTVGLIKRALDGRLRPLLVIALESARRVAVEGDELCVEFAPEGRHMRDTLSKPENMRLLREVCCEVLGREAGVRVNTRTPGEDEDSPPAREDEARLEQKRLRELAETHSVVSEWREGLRLEIVEVQPLARLPQQ